MRELNHIAFIMDGNGRWAQARGKRRTTGHKKGVDALIETVDACCELGIPVISVFAFSTENWARPKSEVARIFRLLEDYLVSQAHKLTERDTRLVVMGDMRALPPTLRETIERVCALTAHCRSRVFNLGINYGGRDEIVRAVNSLIANGAKSVTEQSLSEALDTGGLPDPDLIIRTGGKSRLSNFMLYQCAYSELYFTDTLWPDFDRAELLRAIGWYSGETRNFGAIPTETRSC